jgi:beta-galactosidase beta subunit
VTLPAQSAAFVRLEAGYLAVLHAADARAPRLAAGAPPGVKQIVVKVAVATE